MTAKPQILLIGDSCLDIYQYGYVERISPEAPVPIFKYSHNVCKEGMVGNVKENLKSLGISNIIIMHGNVSTKTRLIDIRSNQHVIRIDEDIISEPLEFSNIPAVNLKVDAIVISDYNKGFISYKLIQNLRNNFSGPIFVDTKKPDLAQLEGCIVKINSQELSQSISQCQNLIVTLGEHGARYQGVTYPAKSVEVVDVCGAGDTFLAAFVDAYMRVCSVTDARTSASSIVEAITYAMRASAVTVQHTGVYAPTPNEIIRIV